MHGRGPAAVFLEALGRLALLSLDERILANAGPLGLDLALRR